MSEMKLSAESADHGRVRRSISIELASPSNRSFTTSSRDHSSRRGRSGGISLYERPMKPVDRTVAAFEVEDIETEVAGLKGNGVEVEGVITLESGVQRAFFEDPDGNIIGMRQL